MILTFRHLCEYLGIELSRNMLDVFHRPTQGHITKGDVNNDLFASLMAAHPIVELRRSYNAVFNYNRPQTQE